MGARPAHYEAAVIDGANRWRQTWHVTLSGIALIVVLMVRLSLGNVLKHSRSMGETYHK